MKGVSAIIATILLLMITIGLAGTAYVYISGMMTGKISKAVSVIDASCTLSTNTITIVVTNDGTDTISNTAGVGNPHDLKILVDNVDKSDVITTGGGTYTIAPREVKVLTGSDAAFTAGSHKLLIISPSNSITSSVYC